MRNPGIPDSGKVAIFAGSLGRKKNYGISVGSLARKKVVFLRIKKMFSSNGKIMPQYRGKQSIVIFIHLQGRLTGKYRWTEVTGHLVGSLARKTLF